MFMLLARTPLPDAAYWPGRRLLAALDAVAWPLGWLAVLNQLLWPGGIFEPVVSVGALAYAAARLRCAVCVNHRYRFATWRWGRAVARLLIVGLALKLWMSA